jgi:hypothetical protein
MARDSGGGAGLGRVEVVSSVLSRTSGTKLGQQEACAGAPWSSTRDGEITQGSSAQGRAIACCSAVLGRWARSQGRLFEMAERCLVLAGRWQGSP